MSPRTLVEVADAVADGDSFDLCLANFLDEFYAAPAAGALQGEPKLLASAADGLGHIQNAYLAATAEELAQKFNLPRPSWVDAESRKLHRPWFASSLAALRTTLLLESPPAFRSRNIFVSGNALMRV